VVPGAAPSELEPAATLDRRGNIIGLTTADAPQGVTIVDIPAGQLGFTLKSCDEARLLDDVKSGELRMALIHVLGPSVLSLGEIADATAMLGTDAKHFIVKNHINETNFFEWDQNSDYARSLRALVNDRRAASQHHRQRSGAAGQDVVRVLCRQRRESDLARSDREVAGKDVALLQSGRHRPNDRGDLPVTAVGQAVQWPAAAAS
jgi:hypothetical protein